MYSSRKEDVNILSYVYGLVTLLDTDYRTSTGYGFPLPERLLIQET